MFVHEDLQLGVGQASFMTPQSLDSARALLGPYMPEALRVQRLDMVFYMLTSVPDSSTQVLYAGYGAEDILRRAFGTEPEDGVFRLEGIVSRKKQFFPAILTALESKKEE